MRSLESAGATIALHGLSASCESRGKSILGLHQKTEFAGIAEDVQRQWIRSGLEILRGHELNPKLWVAPRHGFDAATLSALHKEGIDFISDGFARIVATRGGVRWIPQQLWEPAVAIRRVVDDLHPYAILLRIPWFRGSGNFLAHTKRSLLRSTEWSPSTRRPNWSGRSGSTRGRRHRVFGLRIARDDYIVESRGNKRVLTLPFPRRRGRGLRVRSSKYNFSQRSQNGLKAEPLDDRLARRFT